MHAGQKLLLILILTILVGAGLVVQPAQAQTVVDLELLLTADASFSMNNDEFEIQRAGYAAAFQSAAIGQAIENSENGIAVGLVYWSSDAVQSVEWVHLQTADDAFNFGATLLTTPRPANGSDPGEIGTLTDIGGAINFSQTSILNNDFVSDRTIVDVSGDGSDNNGDDLPTARTNFLNSLFCTGGSSCAINGIAILNDPNEPVNQPGEIGLYQYYVDNVIGGTDAFAFSALGFEGDDIECTGVIPGMTAFNCFQDAIFAKLLLEIGGPTPNGVIPEPATALLFGGGLCAFIARRRKQQTL